MMQRSIISEKPNLTSAPTGASTISHFQSLNKSKADNELNESGIGVSYFQRYARVNDSNLNIRQNKVDISCLEVESIVPQTLDNDSDNGIIEQRSEIHDINQIQDAESASEDSEGQNLEDANDYFIEKVTLEEIKTGISSNKNVASIPKENFNKSQILNINQKAGTKLLDKLTVIKELNKSTVIFKTKSSQLLDKMLQCNEDNRTPRCAMNSKAPSEYDEGIRIYSQFKPHEKQTPSCNFGWMQNPSKWVNRYVQTFDHQLRYQNMIDKITASACSELLFPGFAFRSKNESDQKSMHNNQNQMTEECKEEFEGKETIDLNANPNCITGADAESLLKDISNTNQKENKSEDENERFEDSKIEEKIQAKSDNSSQRVTYSENSVEMKTKKIVKFDNEMDQQINDKHNGKTRNPLKYAVTVDGNTRGNTNDSGRCCNNCTIF